jgi:hypothetical protein
VTEKVQLRSRVAYLAYQVTGCLQLLTVLLEERRPERVRGRVLHWDA